MKPLLQYHEDRLRMTEAEFVARHPSPVLVHRIQGQGKDALSFKTTFGPPQSRVERIYLTKALSALPLGPHGARDDDSLVVFEVAKRAGSAFAGQISVGRTRTLDVWLPFGKISKLHAYFTPHDNGTRYTLTDAGSTNGTFVSGKQLSRDQPVELRSGALIQFGDFQCLFFMPQALYALLGGT
jgi:hypothetical protein